MIAGRLSLTDQNLNFEASESFSILSNGNVTINGK